MTQAAILAASGSSGTTTGFKNKLINGNFDFWQRGTSATITTSGIAAADRWQYITDGTLSTGTVFTQQTFAAGQTDVPNNPTYYLNWQYTSVNTPSNYLRQRIENVLTCAGQTITVSVYAKCASGTIPFNISYQQEFGTGGSPSSGYYPALVSAGTLTTSWQKFTVTLNVASVSGKTIGTNNDSALNIVFAPTSSTSGTISLSQAQVEVGTTATNYDLRPQQVELALCQRYFFQGVISGSGCSSGGTAQFAAIKFPQIMRTTPTLSWISGGRIGAGNTDTAITGITGTIGGTTNDFIVAFQTSAYGSAGLAIVAYNSPIISLNAEL